MKQEALAVGSDHWFRDLAEEGGDVFFVVRIRPDVAVEFGSQTIEQQLGYPINSFFDEVDLLARSIDPRDAETLERVLAMTPGTNLRVELRWRHRDGHPVWTDGVIRCRCRADGSVILEGTLHDITDLRSTEEQLIRSAQQYRLLAEAAGDVIWTMGLDGSITYISPMVEKVRGLTPAEAAAQTLDQIHPPESEARVREYYDRLFAAIDAGKEPPTFHGEQEYYRKDGTIMYGELEVIPQLDESGDVVQILGVTRDISERKRFEAELRLLSATDPLTGAWNRRQGQTILVRDIAEARRYGTQLCLLMLDLDHFKKVNDTYGHHVGDKVLVEFTRRLSEVLRDSDVLVRWGGEEFVILLRHCTTEKAVPIAEKFRAIIAGEQFDGAGQVTVSIGIAELHQDDLTSWLNRADAAMYEAKEAGRNTVRCDSGP